jgi:hypothetical protein
MAKQGFNLDFSLYVHALGSEIKNNELSVSIEIERKKYIPY